MSPLVEKIIQTNKVSIENILSKREGIYTFLNPVSYLDALNHPELFKSFDGIFADGGLLVKAIKVVYGKKIHRWSFDMGSMAPIVFEHAQQTEKSIAIIATKQEVVERAVRNLQTKLPGLNISYYRNGYFSSEAEQDEEAKKIVQQSPDFLIVGMGIIKQEEFLLKVKKAGFKGIGFTCGGFIHQMAQSNLKDYYPKWINDYGLRFLYRIYKEPHTRRRYAKAAFIFPIKFLLEKIKS
jgi:exopolysaccharide biosynthesis WecB/TagA/CpsF family protein